MTDLLAETVDDRATGFHDDEYPEATERRRWLAARLRNNPDAAWGEHIGPMLDEMERWFM